MKKLSLILVVLMLAIAAAGCGKPGSEYVGKWLCADKNAWDGSKMVRRLTIQQNGENFIVSESVESYEYRGPMHQQWGEWKASKPQTTSATLKEGKLAINPFFSFTYVQSNATLIDPSGKVYMKETADELGKMKKAATADFQKRNPKLTIKE